MRYYYSVRYVFVDGTEHKFSSGLFASYEAAYYNLIDIYHNNDEVEVLEAEINSIRTRSSLFDPDNPQVRL